MFRVYLNFKVSFCVMFVFKYCSNIIRVISVLCFFILFYCCILFSFKLAQPRPMQADPNQQTRAQRLLHFPPTRGLLPCGPVGACLQLLSHMKYPFLISSSPTTPCTSFVTLAWSRLLGFLHSPARPAPCAFSFFLVCMAPSRTHLQALSAKPAPAWPTCLASLPQVQPRALLASACAD